MKPECGCSHAHSGELEVAMRYRQRQLPTARARELCATGMSVQTSKVTLPVGTLIEIELEKWGQHWLIPAVVIDSDGQGVVLSFQNPQHELFGLQSEAVSSPLPQVADCGLASAVPS